jgi:hypothetical protein
MKRFFWLLLLSVLVLPPAGLAQVETELLDFDGYDFEDPDVDLVNFGGAGDWYNMYGLVPTTNPTFLVTDHVANQYTIKFTDLVSTGFVDTGPFRTIYYSTGRVEVFEDSRTTGSEVDEATGWGINPPNAQVPADFCDGLLILGGDVTAFIINLNPGHTTGSANGMINFDAGSQLANIPIDATKVYTFSGLTAGEAPEGYVHQVTGSIKIEQPVQVHDSTWGRMKALYR